MYLVAHASRNSASSFSPPPPPTQPSLLEQLKIASDSVTSMRHHGDKEQPRPSWDDRVSRWIQKEDAVVGVSAPHAAECDPSQEGGLVSDLHRECLAAIQELRSKAQSATDGFFLEPDEGISLGRCYAELNLWGDVLRDGSLEITFRTVPDLHQTILENLEKIGSALVQGEGDVVVRLQSWPLLMSSSDSQAFEIGRQHHTWSLAISYRPGVFA